MDVTDRGKEMAAVLRHYGCIDQHSYSKIKIVCPFHNDVRPSMQADLEYGSCKCFGCGVVVNPIEFVMRKEKCNELMAFAHLQEIMSGKAASVAVQIVPRKSNKEAIADSKHFFYTLPKTDWNDIDDDHYLFKRGFSAKALNKVDCRENFNSIYGVVFPMLDMGKFKGYVCRATCDVQDRKYLYNEGFSRYGTLAGNYDKHWPIITEGFLDMVRVNQFGVKNCAAILGWKATPAQISKIQQYTDYVISGLDNTPTGEDGTKFLEQYFHVVRFQFPDYRKDLGDLESHEWSYAWKKTKKLVLNY